MTRTFLLALVLVAARAPADCYDWKLSAWPPSGTKLPTNGRIVLIGYGLAQPQVAKIAERKPRLLAKSLDPLTFTPPIRLEVVELHVGELKLTQAVLKPEKPLFPGTRYTLAFEQTADDPDYDKGGRPFWFGGDGPDLEPPTWEAPPTPGPGHYKDMGCGPIEEARVSLAVKDQSLQLIRARVQGATGGVREYLIKPGEGEVMVGHSMCWGPFILGEGEWSLELDAVDLAGNAAPAPGGPLRFKGLNAKK